MAGLVHLGLVGLRLFYVPRLRSGCSPPATTERAGPLTGAVGKTACATGIDLRRDRRPSCARAISSRSTPKMRHTKCRARSSRPGRRPRGTAWSCDDRRRATGPWSQLRWSGLPDPGAEQARPSGKSRQVCDQRSQSPVTDVAPVARERRSTLPCPFTHFAEPHPEGGMGDDNKVLAFISSSFISCVRRVPAFGYSAAFQPSPIDFWRAMKARSSSPVASSTA